MLFLWESTRKSLANYEITNDFDRFSRRFDLFTNHGTRQTVTLKLTDVNLYELFDAIRKQTGLRFLYNAEQMKEVPKVSVDVKDKKVKDVLTEVLSKTSLTFEYNKGVVTVVKKRLPNLKKN